MGNWAGWLPPEGRFGSAVGARIRATWQRAWSGASSLDGVRLAAIGFDPTLEAALANASSVPARARSPTRALLVAVTGLDGSGKTTQVQRLVAALTAAGYRVAALKPYRQGEFLRLADELGARTRCG
ncbi:MAG: hypothetical protein FJ100_22890, partial [Deltaproteobacteria bacterium]|nr:hypothetical protein [Deltaproteobacteria bacterium]